MAKPRTIDDFAGEWRLSGTQMNYRDCPECGSQNFKVYVCSETGRWICFRCEARGKVDVGKQDVDALRTRLMEKYKSGPMSWGLANLPPSKRLSCYAADYMADQYRLGRHDAESLGLREDANDEGRIIIPYMDRAGDVIYYSKRSYIGEEPKYLNMPGKHPLYVPAWVRGLTSSATFDDLVLVEGAFDAMKVYNVWPQVAAIGGKSLARYLLHEVVRMKPFRVRVALDGDNAGREAGLKLANQLAPFVDKVERVVLPLGQDPGSMTHAQLKELFL